MNVACIAGATTKPWYAAEAAECGKRAGPHIQLRLCQWNATTWWEHGGDEAGQSDVTVRTVCCVGEGAGEGDNQAEQSGWIAGSHGQGEAEDRCVLHVGTDRKLSSSRESRFSWSLLISVKISGLMGVVYIIGVLIIKDSQGLTISIIRSSY